MDEEINTCTEHDAVNDDNKDAETQTDVKVVFDAEVQCEETLKPRRKPMQKKA